GFTPFRKDQVVEHLMLEREFNGNSPPLVPQNGDLTADLNRAVKNLLLERRGFSGALIDRGINFFEQAWYCGDDGWANFFDVLGDGLDAASVIDLHTKVHINIEHCTFEDVGQRKETERCIVRSQLKNPSRIQSI